MQEQKLIILNQEQFLFRKITLEEKEDIMRLFNACEDFFILSEGKIPENGEAFFHELPSGKRIQDKYVYGVFDKHMLIGAIDIVADYPEKGEWIIGLLLLHPNKRGIGLGKKIHDVIKDLVRQAGGVKLRIAVVEQNINGQYFWKKMGYTQKKITKPRKFGIKESCVMVMNCDL